MERATLHENQTSECLKVISVPQQLRMRLGVLNYEPAATATVSVAKQRVQGKGYLLDSCAERDHLPQTDETKHITLKLAAGNPNSVGPVYILASKAESGADPNQQDFWLDGAGQALAVLAYDQCSPDHNAGQGYLQYSHYSDTAPIDRARPCRYMSCWGGLAPWLV